MIIRFFIVILGLCLGSFLNVCIYRIPQGLSVIWPPSYCPYCRKTLRWLHKLPVVSYLWLGGRCFWCKAEITLQYPLVELLTGGVLLLLYSIYGLSGKFFHHSGLALLLIGVAAIDVKTLIIPNILILFGLGFWLLTTAFFSINFLDSFLGALCGGGILLFIAMLGTILFHKESMGMGDVKLGALIGLFLGTHGIFFTLIWAVFLGALIGIIGLGTGILNRNSKLPFGLFLSISALSYLIIPMRF
ncbi:MAG: prepilin peptidase [Calditrichaeota bacterium]|nr:MAG: prepilin peptidase [Calditrichota bacterium]